MSPPCYEEIWREAYVRKKIYGVLRVNEFEQSNQKVVTYKIELPSAVHACQLLKNANLPKEKRDLAQATVPDLTDESMKKQIKATYDQCSASENKKVESSGD